MPRTKTLALALTPLLLGTVACTPQARYPAIQGDVATETLNMLPSPLVMRLALHRVATRHMSGVTAYDIMLPAEVNDETATDIAVALGEDVYVTRQLKSDRPVLRIARVWILGDTATVEVERPVPAAGARQLLTVRLRSDIRGWRVEGVRSWPVGFRFEPQTADPMIIEESRPGESMPPVEDMGDDPAPELEMDTAPVDDSNDSAELEEVPEWSDPFIGYPNR